jgi:hypothetical protein
MGEIIRLPSSQPKSFSLKIEAWSQLLQVLTSNLIEIHPMNTNRGVVYIGPGKVEVKGIDYPKFVAPNGKEIDHGVILRVASTNICGSDQHMVRGQ